MQEDSKQLKDDLKRLIIEESGKEFNIEDISDDEPLFGDDGKIMLDSLDALQISVAIHRKYGKKLTDSKDVIRVFKNINTLFEYINKDS